MSTRAAFLLGWLACVSVGGVASAAELRFQTVLAPDGMPLNVVEAGPTDAPGILFIHGVGQNYASWDRQLQSDLADSFHLVAFDLRGHGGSGKPWRPESYNQACIWADDVAAVMTATALKRPVMVVWSYGGTVGMDYVRCRGTDNLAGIVFAAARGGLYPNSELDPRIPAASEKLRSPDLGQNIQGAQEFTSFLTASPLPPEIEAMARVTNLMYPPYARQANDGPKSLPDGSVYKNNEDLIPRLTLPLLFALGEKDAFSSARAAEAAIRERLPKAELKTYPNAGHWIFFDAAEPFNRDLRDFATRAISNPLKH
ncbi:MAG: alpha/beta hydrolase [Rhodospirillaceae bacterium]|nr:alpha/beta hydrolase [Rhodospirillaceae bacterium]